VVPDGSREPVWPQYWECRDGIIRSPKDPIQIYQWRNAIDGGVYTRVDRGGYDNERAYGSLRHGERLWAARALWHDRWALDEIGRMAGRGPRPE
jgi:hypothetical protein